MAATMKQLRDRWARIIDPKSQLELRAVAGAKKKGNGWEFPGVNGLVLSPACLLASTLLRINDNEPPIGAMFAQTAAERLQAGGDPQEIARGMLVLVE